MLTRAAMTLAAVAALAACTAHAEPLAQPGAEVTLAADPAPASSTAGTEVATEPVATEPAPSPVPGPFTFAVVGDSLSVGNSPYFEEGEVGDLSWVAYAQGDGADFIGGTAVVGATSWWQLERAKLLPDEVLGADVLVMALGTNDMSATARFDATIEALTGIADLWTDADRVLVLAVPPRLHELAATTTEFNMFLQNLAAEHDWEYVDAASAVREGEEWAAGMTGDGIHYTRAAIPLVGAYVGEALRGER